MLLPNMYSTGEFAKRSNVSIRTIRYYDKIGLLTPSATNEAGYRFYTDLDFIRLQKIIVLKNLGFSLEDIAAMIQSDMKNDTLKKSFDQQLQLIDTKIEELKRMQHILSESSKLFDTNDSINWTKAISLIHLMNMEETLTEQYKNTNNVDVRIRLHQRYSFSPISWFPWIYSCMQVHPHYRILELGCGNGQFWLDNTQNLPKDLHIILSDISNGMMAAAKRNLSFTNLSTYNEINFETFDCQSIPYESESFDVILANHLLFYMKDIDRGLQEIERVLKPCGHFYCTTYGHNHMKEIDQLVKGFEPRIALSEINLYDIFGLDHGKDILSPFFSNVTRQNYEDHLLVTDPKDLLDYIYSCHGNQITYLKGCKDEFNSYVTKKVGKKGLYITKEAGLFDCTK